MRRGWPSLRGRGWRASWKAFSTPVVRTSARPASQHSEEALDVRVGCGVSVPVEVRAPAGRAAVPGQAGEEGFDVRVGGGVAVVVEVAVARRAYRAPVRKVGGS